MQHRSAVVAAPEHWFHQVALPGGEVTPGGKPLAWIEAEASVYFRYGIAGKSFLDIGAWDGAYSFEAERRGARDVLATDHFCWTGKAWAGHATKAGFDYAHKRLKSRVRSQIIDVPDISPATVGRFDVVLMAGVLYHVKNPRECLEAAASVASELLIIETVTSQNDRPEALLEMLQPGELGGDETNFFVPNLKLIEAVLSTVGFSRFEATLNPAQPNEAGGRNRHIVHAFR